MAKTTGAPYVLPYPESTDVANVPSDLQGLAEKVEENLDSKMQKGNWTDRNGQPVQGTDAIYQARIQVLSALPTSGNEGDIVFLVP